MSKILVTGGLGFIGSHLIDRLIEDDNTVICIDNLITGQASNLDHLKKNKSLTIINHDITKPIDIGEKIEYIYHMASPASPIDYARMPIETLIAGSIGTRNILDIARKNNARFLLASTSEVYGDPLEHPQKETYHGNVNPVGPRSCYDEAKRFSEALTMAYYRKHKTNVIIARIFNTYGPRMRAGDGRVIPNFINQALRNEPVTINGDGNQTRSFCYVSDLVDGLIKLMQSDIKGEVFNIGNPDERTVKELAEVIKKLTCSKSRICDRDLPEDDPTKRLPDITKAEKKLSWKPKIDLETGLMETISHFKDNLGNIKHCQETDL